MAKPKYDIGMRFGPIIKARRQAAGLSQVELAKRLGVAKSVVSDAEVDRRIPSLALLHKVSVVLEFDIRDFFVPTYEASDEKIDRIYEFFGECLKKGIDLGNDKDYAKIVTIMYLMESWRD